MGKRTCTVTVIVAVRRGGGGREDLAPDGGKLGRLRDALDITTR
jgi:hypothetical protein